MIPYIAYSQEKRTLEKLSLEELMKVEVITPTRHRLDVTKAPATVYVVTREDIELRQYRTLEDLLEDIPEIEIQKKADGESWNNLTIRGVSGNEKLIIMIDGVRISALTGDPTPIAENFPLMNVERVEIILGPASVVYGPDAMSGVINIITSKPTKTRGSLESAYGRFGTTEARFDFHVRLGDRVMFSLLYGEYFSDEPFFPKYYPEEYAWYTDVYSKTGEVKLLGSTDTIRVPIAPYETPTRAYFIYGTLNFHFFTLGYIRITHRHSTSLSVKPEYTLYKRDAFWKTTLEMIFVKHEYFFNQKRFRLSGTISFHNYFLSPQSKFINVFSLYQDAYKYGSGRSFRLHEQMTWELSKHFRLVTGFEFESTAVLPRTSDLPFPFNPNLPADVQGLYYLGTDIVNKDGKDLRIYQDFYHMTYQDISFYTQIEWEFPYNVIFFAGIRYDDDTRYTGVFSPRVGLIWLPTERWSIKFLYGEGFLAPPPSLAYQHFGAFAPVKDESGAITGLISPFFRLPNPALRPERLRNFEANILYQPTSWLMLQGDVFWNNLRDTIGTKRGEYATFKGVVVKRFSRIANVGEQKAWGGTLLARFLFQYRDSILSSSFAYGYVNGLYTNDAELPYIAKHTIKTSFEYRYRHLFASLQVRLRGKTYHPEFDQNGNQIHSNPYTYVRLTAEIRNLSFLHFNFTPFLVIQNLFDVRYYNVREGGGSTELLQVPQDPLKFLIGVRVSI